jgi:xanthine dehydrogenase YagR molybdenum-binding subunit
MNNFVAVQDCGLIIDTEDRREPGLWRDDHGRLPCSLYEEKIMDDQTGRMLNPNMEFYKLAGLDRHRQLQSPYDDRQGLR